MCDEVWDPLAAGGSATVRVRVFRTPCFLYNMRSIHLLSTPPEHAAEVRCIGGSPSVSSLNEARRVGRG